MIDSLRLFKAFESEAERSKWLGIVSNYKVKNTSTDSTQWTEFNHDRFFGKVTFQGLFVNLNLNKLYRGVNYENYGLDEIKMALSKLSDFLSDDILSAKVTYLAFGVNFQSKLSTETMFKHFAEAPRLTRNVIYKTTLYYDNKSRSYKLYNKTLENDLPSISGSLSRFEITYKKNVASKFGVRDLTLQSLVNNHFQTLFELFKKEFESIEVLPEIDLNLGNVERCSDYLGYITAKYVSETGSLSSISRELDLIEKAQHLKNAGRKSPKTIMNEKYRTVRKIKSFCSLYAKPTSSTKLSEFINSMYSALDSIRQVN